MKFLSLLALKRALHSKPPRGVIGCRGFVITCDIISATEYWPVYFWVDRIFYLSDKENERLLFEKDAAPLGYVLHRRECPCGNPACEYEENDTGQRWAGWLAAKGVS